jgi:RimJ/RimL family protein N-acetyltransferase
MKRLHGSMVCLSELRTEDSSILFEWINNPETTRHNAPYAPVHETSHEVWFKTATASRDRIIFGIRRLDSDHLVGTVQLFDIHPVHRSAELSIRIGDEAHRGQGFGSEAVRLATRFAFEDRNLQRVWLRAIAENRRAIRAYEKAGFHQEGLLRRSCFIGGRWCDEVVMAALAGKS